MTDKKLARTHILPSDVDQRGNVVVYDHGPRESDADHKEWHEKNVAPMPLVMHSGDAGHAMSIEPHRYAMEPHDMPESAIEDRMQVIRDKREAAKVNAMVAVDRKQAIAELMSERAAAVSAEHAADEPAEKDEELDD